MIQRLKRNSADEKSPKTGKTQHLKDFTGNRDVKQGSSEFSLGGPVSDLGRD